jgi:hypothetical protein
MAARCAATSAKFDGALAAFALSAPSAWLGTAAATRTAGDGDALDLPGAEGSSRGVSRVVTAV